MSAESIALTMIVIALAAVGAFWWFLEKKNDCKVRIKELVKGRKIIKDFKAGYYEDEDKVAWWKLSGEKDKRKRLIPLPPEEAIEIDKKGKKCVEAYRFEDGTIVYSRDDWDVASFPENLYQNIPEDIVSKLESTKEQSKKKEILDAWKKKIYDEWKANNKVIAPNEPINTKQRMLYLNNIKRAESRKGFDWKAQLVPIASMAIIGLIVVCLMVFWGDIAAPALKANEQAVGITKMQTEQLEILKEIKLGIQKIDNKPVIDNKVPY